MTSEQFEELFRRFAPEVHAYLSRRVREDADDLLGEVFVVAWARRGDLPKPELRRAWLYGVARRLILANSRKATQLLAASRELSRRGDAQPTDQSERDVAVRRVVESLPPADRELIMLTSWEGLTVAEVAFALGIRPGTARVRLHRARKRLASDPRLHSLIQSVLDESLP